MNTEKTALEIYAEQSTSLIHKYLDNSITTRELLRGHHNLFYLIQEVEKKQIEESWNDGNLIGRNGWIIEEYTTGEGYYKKKYKK